MEKEKEMFKNLEEPIKVHPVPNDSKINDIVTNTSILDDIVYVTEDGGGVAPLNELESLTEVSQTRDNIYNALDVMAEDPRISAALDIYTSNACEPNDHGQIVWCESSDSLVTTYVTHLLDMMNVDKYAYLWMYSLVKYGDLYLKLYRESDLPESRKNKDDKKKSLHEALIFDAYKESDPYIKFMAMHHNPAEMFELQDVVGKSVGYVTTSVPERPKSTDSWLARNNYLHQYNFDYNDVHITDSRNYVHACLDDTSTRYREEIILGNAAIKDEPSVTYSVRRGRPLLYDAYRIWQKLNLLEQALLLNRITKSASTKIVALEVGDMEPTKAQKATQSIKNILEKKLAIAENQSFSEYPTNGAADNIMYITTHNGIGAISVSTIGGESDVNTKLDDVEYYKTKLYAALRIPKQYLGDTDDATGFNGGTVISLASSEFAKRIKRLQSAFTTALESAINLHLENSKMYEYVGKFSLKMQAPATQEEETRRQNQASSMSNIQTIMQMAGDAGLEKPAVKMQLLTTLLTDAGINPEVTKVLQDEADAMKQQTIDQLNGGGDDMGGGFAGGGGMDMGMGDLGGDMGDLGDTGEGDLPSPEDLGGSDEIASEPVDTGAAGGAEATPEEAFDKEFEGDTGKQLLTEEGEEDPEDFDSYQIGGGFQPSEETLEDDDLPSFDALNVKYSSIK